VAAREGVILMDMSFMAKFRVEGAGSGAFLDRLSTARVDGGPERITYTQWLNEAGGIEADLTVTKLGEDRFWVVATDTAHRHAATWMARHAPNGIDIDDVTDDYAQTNVQGPRSRDLLQTLTSADLSNEAFPFRTARHVELGGVEVLCIRITYLGELGYELYVPADRAVALYDRLVEAGQDFQLRHAGLKALASLRMEKGYRDYGHDIDNTDSLVEAGLAFTVDLDKPGGFIGQEAVVRDLAARPPRRLLVQILVGDPEPLLFHGEVVYREGRAVGYVRSASYGHTLGGAVGLVMVEAGKPVTDDHLDSGTWEVEIAGERFPARLSRRPLYDPRSERVRS